MRLRVLEAYGHVTLQDAGRPGWRSRGVPPGGAFDRESLALANALVGNAPGAPGLELGLGTLVLSLVIREAYHHRASSSPSVSST